MRNCKKSSARQRRLRLTTARTRSSDSIDTPSDASFVQDDEEQRSLSDLIRENIQTFKQVFRFSRLRPDKSVEWAETAEADKRKLCASFITNHRCMHPALYTCILHPGSLAQIIEKIEQVARRHTRVSGNWLEQDHEGSKSLRKVQPACKYQGRVYLEQLVFCDFRNYRRQIRSPPGLYNDRRWVRSPRWFSLRLKE